MSTTTRQGFDFHAAREAAERDGHIQSSGGWFKLKDGDNRVRLVAGPLAHPDTYNGKPNFKWLFQVIDRADGQVKPFFMSPVIFDALGDLQKDPDFEFSEVPLPFDINIKTSNAGTLKARYSVIPSPRRTPISGDEQKLIDASTTLPELQKILREKKGDTTPTTNEPGRFDPDEIPF